MQPLVLSSFSLVTCLGAGDAETIDALRSGRSGLAPCHFETAAIPTFVGEVQDFEDVAIKGAVAGFNCRNNRLAQKALSQDGFSEAVASARARYGADRIGVIVGTSMAGILATELGYRARVHNNGSLPCDYNYAGTHNSFSLGRYVGAVLGLEGPATAISTACATTAKAFGSAARWITAGLCDAAIVGGADTLCLTTLYGFRSLELTAEDPCRPFDIDRAGISLGEAGGFVLLERPRADTPDDAILLFGVGESADAYHMSSPHPEGLGARLAMERALASAQLRPQEIDYVNLHGTATRVGDAAEDKAIVSVFGTGTPCSSTKGQTGHTLGAAGITEALISTLSLKHGFMPGSPTTRTLDPEMRCRYLLEGEKAPLARVMSNSFGFGGSNCSLILGYA